MLHWWRHSCMCTSKKWKRRTKLCDKWLCLHCMYVSDFTAVQQRGWVETHLWRYSNLWPVGPHCCSLYQVKTVDPRTIHNKLLCCNSLLTLTQVSLLAISDMDHAVLRWKTNWYTTASPSNSGIFSTVKAMSYQQSVMFSEFNVGLISTILKMWKLLNPNIELLKTINNI